MNRAKNYNETSYYCTQKAGLNRDALDFNFKKLTKT